MWNPTHVEVTVSRARNLKAKGKSGTNDAYVTIKLGKEKFQTTLRERAKDPEWHEQCQFSISEKHSLVKLKVFHRNLIGQDDFLGYVEIPLDSSLVYERPQSKWYNLRNRPGDKGPEKYRGEIEVFVTYVVQSISGSHISLNTAEQSKRHLSLKGLTNQFEKLHMKGSLKKNLSRLSENSFRLGNISSECEQGGSTLPSSSDRKSPDDGTVAGCVVREEVDEHEVLRDEKHHLKSSVFKFPFGSKKKRLQRISLLSQSTLVLPSMKSAGNELRTVKEVVSKHPPSESSSGFGSRRVSASESQSSSGGDSLTQEKAAADLSNISPVALEDSASSSEVKEASAEEVIIDPKDEMLRLEVNEGLKDDDDASIPSIPVHGYETVSTTADVREDGQKQGKGSLPDRQEISMPSVEPENILEPNFDRIEDNEVVKLVKSAENMLAAITKEDEPGLITGDTITGGLNTSRSVTESVQSELDLSSPALQHASSDLSEYFTGHMPQRLQSESAISTVQPTSVLLKSDPGSFSEAPDLALNSTVLSFESARLVLQSLGTISDSSDRELEIQTQESVFKDSSCDLEAAPALRQSAPVSDSLLPKTNTTFTDEKSLNNKIRNRTDECTETTDRATPAVASPTVASLRQPAQQTPGSRREVERKKISESHEQLSMERDEEVIPSASTFLLPEEILQQFHHCSRDDLIQIILDQRRLLREKDAYIKDLQSYIDNLLVKVIDIQPRLLMTDESCSSSGSTTTAFHTSSTESGKLNPSSSGLRASDPQATGAHVAYKTGTNAASSVTATTSPKAAAPRKLAFRNPFKAKK